MKPDYVPQLRSNPECWREGAEHELNDVLYFKAKDIIFDAIRSADTMEKIETIGTRYQIEFETLDLLAKVNAKRYTVIPEIKEVRKYYQKLLEDKLRSV